MRDLRKFTFLNNCKVGERNGSFSPNLEMQEMTTYWLDCLLKWQGSFEAQKQGLLVLMEPNEGDPCRPLQESGDFYIVKISVQMVVIMSK